MFSHYLLYFQPVSKHTSLTGWKRGGETCHQTNSQISTGLPLKLCLQTPAKLQRGTTASSSHPTAGSLIATCVRPGSYLEAVLSVIYLQMRCFTSGRVIHSAGNTDRQPHQPLPGRQQPTWRTKGQRQIQPVPSCQEMSILDIINATTNQDKLLAKKKLIAVLSHFFPLMFV